MSNEEFMWVSKTGAVMSASYWYKRFEEELAGEIFAFSNRTDDDVVKAVKQCKDAAKRVAQPIKNQ